MHVFACNPLWQKALVLRKRQKIFGLISAVFLGLALLGLIDGLISQMRSGSNELELLPGQSITISGPAALKNPLNSDVIARFTPDNAPLRFELEGFFSGYWFGSGMWRGQITADEHASPGEFTLAVSFRGASNRGLQKYVIKIFATPLDMRHAALSLLRRHLDVNPFILAAGAALGGVLLGLATYFYGRRFAQCLTPLGLAEIYAASRDRSTVWCLAPRHFAPPPGSARMIFNMTGKQIAEARAEEWKKGKLRLTVLDGGLPEEDLLICLEPPSISDPHGNECQIDT